jgi:N-methylhydantoinase A/oxoprolinase/acetone carboxylase beta subunit
MSAYAHVQAYQGVTLEDIWAALMELRRQVQSLQEAAGTIPAAVVPEPVILDKKTAAMEMNRIRKVVEESGIHTDSHDVAGVLEELIRQAQTEAQAAEYRRMLDLLPAIDAARERNRPESIKAWLKQREEDWADPWEAAEAATQERRRPLRQAQGPAVGERGSVAAVVESPLSAAEPEPSYG